MNAGKKPSQKRKDEVTWPLILAAAIFLLGVYLIINAIKPRMQAVEPADPRQAELNRQQKIEYYKRQLGEKLNRSRNIAEYELRSGERRREYAVQVRPLNSEPDASVDGLPLDYEKRDWAPREESQIVSGVHPDAKVAYELQEQQNKEFWEEEAQRLFLRQYIINARSKGYDVAIDRDYNVIVKRYPQKVAGQRIPQSVGDEVEQFKALRFAPPFFVQPICRR